MNALNKILKTGAILVAVGMTTVAANAATVTTFCPDSASSSVRDFSLTVDDANGAAVCVTSGTGNTDNNPSEAIILAGVAPGVLLDKSDGASIVAGVVINVTGVGALSGLWSILVPQGYALVDAFLALKSGDGNGDPDWALFSLPNGTLAGSWAIDDPTCAGNACNGQQTLSHANLYGRLVAAPTVPLPAGAPLLLAGLGALALLRRKRRS